jgi:uncharacterized protein (UPF0332 family)
MTKRGREGIERAEAFLRTSRSALDAKDPHPAVLNMFPACEYAANVLREYMGDKPSERHDAKLEGANRAYSKGLIAHKEYEAYKRVYQLKPLVQYDPYDKVQKTKKPKVTIDTEEAEALYQSVKSLVRKSKKYA